MEQMLCMLCKTVTYVCYVILETGNIGVLASVALPMALYKYVYDYDYEADFPDNIVSS